MGDRHGGALLDLHEGLVVCDKKAAFGEVGLQGWQRGWRRGWMRRRAGVRRIHPLGQALDGGGELRGEIADGREGIPLTSIQPVVAVQVPSTIAGC